MKIVNASNVTTASIENYIMRLWRSAHSRARIPDFTILISNARGLTAEDITTYNCVLMRKNRHMGRNFFEIILPSANLMMRAKSDLEEFAVRAARPSAKHRLPELTGDQLALELSRIVAAFAHKPVDANGVVRRDHDLYFTRGRIDSSARKQIERARTLVEIKRAEERIEDLHALKESLLDRVDVVASDIEDRTNKLTKLMTKFEKLGGDPISNDT